MKWVRTKSTKPVPNDAAGGVDAEVAEDIEDRRIRGEGQRDAWFGFGPDYATEDGEDDSEPETPGQQPRSIP